MRRLALPVTLALAAMTASNLAAQELQNGIGTYLPQTAAPAPPTGHAQVSPVPQRQPFAVADVTPSYLPPPNHGNGHETSEAHGGHSHLFGCHATHEWGGLFGTAELLIWRPRWQNMDYAIIDPGLNLTPQGVVSSLALESRAGLRLGVGYLIPDSHWSVAMTYTYIRSEDEDGLRARAGGNLYPTLTRPGLIDVVSTARAESRLRYNVFDLDFIRDMSSDDCFTFRFHGGLRFASVDFAMNAFYDGADAIRAVTAIASDFDGVGPTVGGQGTWNVGRGLSVFGRGRASLLYGEIHGRFRETDRGGLALHADLTNNLSRAVPVIDLGLGVQWQYRNVQFAFGYEINHWFQLAETPQFVDDFSPGKFVSRQSSLSLDGVFFRFGVQY